MSKEEDKGTPLFDGEVLDRTDMGEMLPEAPGMSSAQPMVICDEASVLALEKAAEYAPRMEEAYKKIIVAVAMAGDWSSHGSVACLGSAGAERFLKYAQISFSNWRREKTEWHDEIGDAYRWEYSAEAEWNGRKILAAGRYSTRDKFLGKKAGEYRPLTEIDESDIQSAAHHICMGAGIKSLLGLRGIKVEELIRLGVPKEKIADAGYTQGSKGGTSPADTTKAAELRKMILEICDKDPEKSKVYLVAMSEFPDKKKPGEMVKGVEDVKKLSAGRLKVVFEKVSKEFASYTKMVDEAAAAAGGGGDGETPADEEPIKY